MRNNDTRCCGTGTCLINAEGMCWCGQRWDGEKMCAQVLADAPAVEAAAGAMDEAPAELGTPDRPPGV